MHDIHEHNMILKLLQARTVQNATINYDKKLSICMNCMIYFTKLCGVLSPETEDMLHSVT